MKFLTLWKDKRQQALKERILKNREGVLDVMSENIKGARQCPFLIGAKCLGGMCEFFLEFVNSDLQTGKQIKYHQCTIIKTPLLLIELRQEISKLVDIFRSAKAEDKK